MEVDPERICSGLAEIDDPLTLLTELFAHAPVGLQVYRADGRSVLVNRTFLDIFGSEPPPEYNVLADEIAAAHGVLPLITRAFAGERVAGIWYEPRDLREIQVTEGRRAAIEATFVPLFDRRGAVSHVGVVFRDLTAEFLAREQQSRTEDALREREAGFHTLFESNPLPMWVYDLATLRFLEVNEAAVQHYGYSREEFLRMTIADIRPADEVPRLMANLAQCRDTWEFSGPWRHRLKDGVVIDVDITSHTLTFQGHSAALVVAQDVTERTRAAASAAERSRITALVADVGVALNKSDSLAPCLQACTKALVTHLDAACARIWMPNRTGDVLELQASASLYSHLDGLHTSVPIDYLKIARIARDRRPHLTNEVVGDPEIPDQVWAASEGMVAFAGHPLIVENRLVGAMAILTRHQVSEGVMASLTAVADHIALGIERHRAEEARRLLAAIVSDSEDAVISTTLDGVVLTWNSSAERLYGFSTAEVVGRSISLVVAPERIDELHKLLNRVRAGEHLKAYETVRRRKDGSPISVSLTLSPLKDATGHIVSVSSIARDITERRLLEEQLRQAQKMEAVGRLAGGVAHDFNNLLTAILGYSKFALEELDPADPVYQDVKEIQAAGESAASLTRQLLAFSRRQLLQPQILDLNSVVERVDSLLRRLIGEDVELITRLNGDLDSVSADAGQIEQIIMNLAVNARDAMPDGGTLTIKTANVVLDQDFVVHHRGAAVGPHVMLAVSDNGVGMDEVVQSHLFEPFFTTKKRGEGTGLGLATVYGIVKQSGGSIWVYSQVGQGTTFKIYLPTAMGEFEPTTIAETPTSLDGTETILLVEDQTEVRVVAHSMLSRRGYTVLEAAGGAEALQVIRTYRTPIDLLLTDVVMPSMSGGDLARELHKTHPEIRVLYASGYTDDAIVRHGILEPGVAFIQKPFTPDSLLRKVREVLDAPDQRSQLRPSLRI